MSKLTLIRGGNQYDEFFEDTLQMTFKKWVELYFGVYLKLLYCHLSDELTFKEILYLFKTKAFFLILEFEFDELSHFRISKYQHQPRELVPQIDKIITQETDIYIQFIFIYEEKRATFSISIEKLTQSMKKDLIATNIKHNERCHADRF